MNYSIPDLANWDEAFVIVAGDDVFPVLTTNTLHVWSNEDEAVDFVSHESIEAKFAAEKFDVERVAHILRCTAREIEREQHAA